MLARTLPDVIELPYLLPPQFSVSRISAALAYLDRYAGTSAGSNELDHEDPVFILAAGWRSGSTLMQRLLVTDPTILIWGEPLGNMGLLTHIAHTLCLIESGRWPPQDAWISETFTPGALADTWIANFYPPAADLRRGLQRLLFEWLGRPAHTRGYARWGFKEVRLGACEALLLAWLFPRARFVVLIRDPCDAYRSLVGAGGARWAETRVHRVADFARHWNRLAMSWMDIPQDFPAVIVRYEDLLGSPATVAQVAALTGLSLRPERVLPNRVGSSGSRVGAPPWWQRAIIKHLAADGLHAFGYPRP